MWQSWPAEIEKNQQTALVNWVSANQKALSQLQQGSEMPYFWLPYPEKSPLGRGPLSMYRQVNSLATAMCWRAKLKASDGDFAGAFNDVLAAYNFGRHLTDRPHRLWEQKTGYDIQITAMWTAGMIMSRSKPDISAIITFQNQLNSLIQDQTFIYDLKGEQIIVNEAIDMTFEDGGVSANSLESFKRNLRFTDAQAAQWQNLQKLPTITAARRLYWYVEGILPKSPAQIKFQKIDLVEEINSRSNANILIQYFRPDIIKDFDLPTRCRAEAQALATICAVKRYQADKGQLPPTLKVLQVTGYIPYEPSDPYSNGILTYIPGAGDFRLYSFGADFKNDNCRMSDWGQGPSGGDQVFWPL